MNTYGFIGCGNMGGILASCCAKKHGENVLLCDHNHEKTTKIIQNYGALPASTQTIAEKAD